MPAKRTRLLLIGGGHSHVEVVRQFGLHPDDAVELVLVSPDRHTPYSGMLPGWIAGHYTHAECHIDLDRVARFARARFLIDRVVAIDPGASRVRLGDGSSLGYDVASIDTGSTPPLAAIDGALEHAVAVKPVDRFIDRLEAFASPLASASAVSVVVIGGGAAGIEVLLSVQHRMRQSAPALRAAFSVVTASASLLPNHAPRVRDAFRRILGERSVTLHESFTVSKIVAGRLIGTDGRALDADLAIVATGAQPAAWPGEGGLRLAESGFIAVNEHLQSVSHPNVFAAGDIANVGDHAYPKSGVYAVRQGPVLAANLRHALAGDPLERYAPQRRSLALISTGDRYAVASRGWFSIEGAWVWRWKDRIDRKFMNKYNLLDLR